ncbi:MAG TPA: hypothetical protein VF040_06270 [Ktedonobacterales bacterium]
MQLNANDPFPQANLGAGNQRGMGRDRGSAQTGYRGPLAWWYRLTMPPEPPASAPVEVRERFRRSRMASVLLFIFLLIVVGSLPLGFQDLPTLYSLLGVIVVCLIAIVLNRVGQVYAVGGLLSTIMIISLVGVLLSGRDGKLDVDYLQLYYLLLIAELFAAALLPPWVVFLIAFVNSGITFASLSLQPAAPTLEGLLKSPEVGLFTLAFPPVALHWAVAGVSFLLVRSATNAIQRADRAEEIVELQQREAERTRELEEGVRQLLAVHVHLANGDFKVRAQDIRNPALWQIGNSLNNLVARLSRFAQAEFVLHRTQEEGRRVAEAIYQYASGRRPIWPAPAQTPMDPVTDALRRALGGSSAPPQGPSQMGPTQGVEQLPPASGQPSIAPGYHPDAASSYYPGSAQPPVPPSLPSDASSGSFDANANLPEWLRHPPDGTGDRGTPNR